MKASLSNLYEEINIGKLFKSRLIYLESLFSSTHSINPPDEAKHVHSSEQILSSASWMMHPNPGKNPISMNMESNHINMLPSSTCPRSNSQFSTLSVASKNSALKYVYRKNKNQKQYAITATGQSSINKENCGLSPAVSSDTKSLSVRDENNIPEYQFQVDSSHIHPSTVNSRSVLNPGALQARVSEEFLERNTRRSGLNHGCSSSKSNLNIGAVSANISVKKTHEFSPLLVTAGNLIETISDKDFCISFLRTHGLLGNGHIRTSDVGKSTIMTCASRTCKTCGGCENTTNLLICDDCENAFHAWCCRPRVNDIPIEEWFCNSCEKKKQKLLKEMKLRKLQNVTEGEAGNIPLDASNVVVTCLDMMLFDIEPHKTEVRTGKGFQADVPEWCEPNPNPNPNPSDSNLVGEALEIDLSESERLPISRLQNPARVNPIGNWLQCREVVHGIGKDIDGTICGKWRRAPLSQVQSDNWDCFSAVFWDPVHADCAAPQELETVEVLKQLKYIQMLKPTSSGKRQKVSDPRRKALQGPSKRARKPLS